MAMIGLGLFHTAMYAGSFVLPLYVTHVLGRPTGDVGVLFSVCAAVEVPAALALMAVPARMNTKRMIALGLALFVLYFALAAITTRMVVLAVAQIARGIAIAVVGALGITHMQELIPGQPGRATTLFANTATAGSLIAGITAGGTAQAVGYRGALLFCGALATAALLVFIAAKDAGSSAGASQPS
jgi:SET family sugar efflux transporter-like MFS transporter